MNEKPMPTDNSAEIDALPAAQDTTTPVSPQPVEKKKRKSHLLLVLLSLLIIAGLGGAATLLAYKYYFAKPASQSQSTPAPVAEKKLTAADTLSLVKSTYPSSASSETGLSVPVKVAGYDYYTGVDQAKVSAIKGTVPYSDSAVVVAKIAKILKEKGFTERIVQNGNDDSMYIANYTQRDVVCETTVTKTYNNPTGDHVVDVACENMSDYIAAASAQKVLYAAYPNKNSDNGTIETIGTVELIGVPKISTSKTAGYNTAQISMGGVATDGTVGVGGFAGLFYQTPDMKWHFFMGAQNTPQCTDYKTDDLKKAYVGTSCLGADGKEATVTL
jgi:hypothetical protein